MDENLLIPNLQDEIEERAEVSLRPKTLDEYIGQSEATDEISKSEYENIYRSCKKEK